MVPDVRECLEVPQMQFCVVGGSSCDHAALCGVYGDRAVQGFSPYFYGFFRPPLRS